MCIYSRDRFMIIGKTKIERLSDVTHLLLDIYDISSVPTYLKIKIYDLYITIWAVIIPKPRDRT